MKTLTSLFFAFLLFNCAGPVAESDEKKSDDMVRPESLAANQNMYVIEREIPKAGEFTNVQLQEISQTSCDVLEEMGSEIQWLHSYVTGDKIYCVYLAPNEEMVREHAEKGGFPANSVSRVANIISPATASTEI